MTTSVAMPDLEAHEKAPEDRAQRTLGGPGPIRDRSPETRWHWAPAALRVVSVVSVVSAAVILVRPGPSSRLRRGILTATTAVLAFAGMTCLGPSLALAQAPGPTIVLVPGASGPPAAGVQVRGEGFADGQRAEIRWAASDGPVLGIAVGPRFALDVVVPGAEPGTYPITAFSRDADGVIGAAATTPFAVTEGPTEGAPPATLATPPPPGVAPPPPEASAAVWVVVIGGLAGLGAVLFTTRAGRRPWNRSPQDDSLAPVETGRRAATTSG